MLDNSRTKNNPPFQVMPAHTPEEYEALKADIEANGVQCPVHTDEHGNIIDGHTRAQICQELGIKDFPTIVHYGLADHEKRQMAWRLNLNQRHLTRDQENVLRAEMLRDALLHDPMRSDRQIAGEIGCSPTTVGKSRKQLESSGELSTVDSSMGADGKVRPRTTQNSIAGMMPESLEKGFVYVGYVRGAKEARLIVIGAAAMQPPAFFVEILCWDGSEVESGQPNQIHDGDVECVFSRRAMFAHGIHLFVTIVEEMQGATSIEWEKFLASDGELSHPEHASYSRMVVDEWWMRKVGA